ncbi:MAG: hypothetical protein ACFCVH_09705 [Alphaproteobacteria bacterium]
MTASASVFRSSSIRRIAAGLSLGIAVTFGATAAQAEMLCGERDQIIGELKKTWKEDRTAIGLSNNGGVLEVFSSDQGTWTLLLTMPDGPTCLIGAGEHWEQTQMALLVGEPV